MKHSIVRVQTSEGGFVDVPCMLREAKAHKVDVRLVDAQNCAIDNKVVPQSYLRFRGVLIQQSKDWSVYSCGGLFLTIRGVRTPNAEFVVSVAVE